MGLSTGQPSDATDRHGREYIVTGDYRYRITSTGFGSQRYGNCEVCHQPADIMWQQVEQQRYDVGGDTGWTEYECRRLFGHHACLIGARR